MLFIIIISGLIFIENIWWCNFAPDSPVYNSNPYGVNSPNFAPDSPDYRPKSPDMNEEELENAVDYYLELLDNYDQLDEGNQKDYVEAIKQFVLNGEDKGIGDEKELVALLKDKYNELKNSKNSRNIQKGGNMITVYTINFTDLEYNSVYLFSRLNFIGFYLTEKIYELYNDNYNYRLQYKLDGSKSCRLTLMETNKDVKFKKYNITSSNRFFVDTRVTPSKDYSFSESADFKYEVRALNQSSFDENAKTKRNSAYWSGILSNMDKRDDDEKQKKLKDLLNKVDNYDKENASIGSDEVSENKNENNDGENNTYDINYNNSEIMPDFENSQDSEQYGEPKFSKDDKVEIDLNNLKLDERGLKVREFAEQDGIIQKVLDNKFYDVQFGGEVLQLNEQELKSYNPDEKVVTLTGLKKQLNTKSTTDLQPEKDAFNLAVMRMRMRMRMRMPIMIRIMCQNHYKKVVI